MSDQTDNALVGVISSLRGIVSPALDVSDPMAVEQLALAIRYLEFLHERLELLHSRHRAELAILLEAADRVGIEPDAIAPARRAIADPSTATRDLRLAVNDLDDLVGEAVREIESPADLAGLLSVLELRVTLDRAWYLPLGFDPAPDELPELENVLS